MALFIMLAQILCFFVLVVYHTEAGAALKVTMSDAKPTCLNEDFIGELESVLDEATATLNMKCTVTKEIPADADCETLFYKQSADGKAWEQLPVSLEKENCCSTLFEDPIYKKAMDNQNLPKECPIKTGSYSVSNMKLQEVPDEVEEGVYRADFTMSQKETCLYGMQTFWKVSTPK